MTSTNGTSDSVPGPPLRGVKILDLSHFLAGPFATMILADLGAEVIRVEPPDGDPIRKVPPFIRPGMGSMYFSTNRNKQGIIIDLKTDEGRAELEKLVEEADVVCHNFRASAAERLGIDYKSLHAINDRLIYCAICGFDSAPPYSELPTTDSLVQAISGVMSITGEADGPPARVGYQIGDTAGGLWAAIAILAGLTGRSQDGRGRYLEVSLLDAQLSLLIWQAQDYLSMGTVYGRLGTALANLPPSQAFECQDGRYVFATPSAIPEWWVGYCRAVALPELADDPRFRTVDDRQRNRSELESLLSARYLTRPADEWVTEFQLNDVPVALVQNIAEAFAYPTVARRNMVVEIDMGDGTTERMVGNPIKTSGEERFSPPPRLGQDTEAVLRRADQTKTRSGGDA